MLILVCQTKIASRVNLSLQNVANQLSSCISEYIRIIQIKKYIQRTSFIRRVQA